MAETIFFPGMGILNHGYLVLELRPKDVGKKHLSSDAAFHRQQEGAENDEDSEADLTDSEDEDELAETLDVANFIDEVEDEFFKEVEEEAIYAENARVKEGDQNGNEMSDSEENFTDGFEDEGTRGRGEEEASGCEEVDDNSANEDHLDDSFDPEASYQVSKARIMQRLRAQGVIGESGLIGSQVDGAAESESESDACSTSAMAKRKSGRKRKHCTGYLDESSSSEQESDAGRDEAMLGKPKFDAIPEDGTECHPNAEDHEVTLEEEEESATQGTKELSLLTARLTARGATEDEICASLGCLLSLQVLLLLEKQLSVLLV